MRPKQQSELLLGVTRSKAKMLEYNIPEDAHIKIIQDPAKLFTISIGLLGDFAAALNREETDSRTISELRTSLLFSAHFFDAYLQSKLNENLDPYLLLMGSASYYLCDLPGSASVLAKRLTSVYPDLNGDGLEDLLLWLLQADMKTYINRVEKSFSKLIVEISICVPCFFADGRGEGNLLNLAKKLREAVYKFGTPMQLLLGDVISAVLRKKLENSACKALPLYSELPLDKWLPSLQKNFFIKELWPAQHLLGKAGVLKGGSAVVQMPTSAGKTKATELILRSAFLANRVSLAIIIAPFRALCHEIKNGLVEVFHNEPTAINELSDALQSDFKTSEFLGHQQILVVTPEKLLYLLRRAPELAEHIGLMIFDEGHQFDNGARGIAYELLLAALRFMIPKRAQKILISAVISNATTVGEWLNGNPNVVEGTDLIPTFRSVGFASWLDQLGKIEYVDHLDAEQNKFFVPRVIEEFKLEKKNRERKDRFFPEKTDGKTVALYLGLKLVSNGSIAVFCGRKSTAVSVCKKAVDLFERRAPVAIPSTFSNTKEVESLAHLHVENLGIDAPESQSARYGIFSHHGNIPHGIRLAVEHAMRNGLVHFVICTSTLAQGVNLPIRYLIVTSVDLGKECITVRDFQNLMGRAGRAGMYTEGSILFADPKIYDKRKSHNDKWRWNQIKELLNPQNSEPCISNLLAVFDSSGSNDESQTVALQALDFVKAYIANPEKFIKPAQDGVERQVTRKISLICAVESFLLSHWDESGNGLSEAHVNCLAEGTFAFFLADEQEKEHIRELFQLLAANISASITDPVCRKVYGRTLYGVHDAQIIEKWVQSNGDNLLSIGDEAKVLDIVWPLLERHMKSGGVKKFDKSDVPKEIMRGWISGKTFSDLMKIIFNRNTMMILGNKPKKFEIHDVINVCETTFSYDAALVMGAVCEFIEAINQDGVKEAVNNIQFFQKRLKYGLPTRTSIALYELGFSDRVIAQNIEQMLRLVSIEKHDLIDELKSKADLANKLIGSYPSYFQKQMEQILN